MSTVKTEVAIQTPMELAIDSQYINKLSEQLTEKQKYGLTFPANYNVTNALNSAYLILQDMTVKRNEKGNWVEYSLLKDNMCTKQSIGSALMDMTVQALNPLKKQCYFILYGNKLTLMRSYQGTMAVAKRCGVKDIIAEVIYDGDVFDYSIKNGRKIFEKHEQDFMNIDLEKIKGAYAILELDNGSYYLEIMNIAQIKKAWKKGKGYTEGKADDVHNEFADQMAMKTVIGRACKNFINSSDDANLMEAFDNTTDNEDINIVEEDVHYEIETQANTEDFIIPEQSEVVKVEVVEKAEKKPTESKQPSWVEGDAK